MSAGPQPLPGRTQDQAVLGELLHSLSQPLTTLRCSLELSVENVPGHKQDSVSVALEQAERVIGMVKLMREYLDAEFGTPPPHPVALAPALSAVVEQLSSLAASRQIRLQLTATAAVSISVAEPQLQMALQYLINALIELQPANREIVLRLEENPWESLLRGQVVCSIWTAVRPRHDPIGITLRRVKLAIATRVLESGGASLVFDDGDQSAFVLRIPKPPPALLA
jgi:signal transduction histidine kinase